MSLKLVLTLSPILSILLFQCQGIGLLLPLLHNLSDMLHADCQKSEQQKHCSNNNCQILVSTAQHCTKTPCSLRIKRLTLLLAPRHNMQSKPMYRRAGDPEVAPPGRRPGETFQDQLGVLGPLIKPRATALCSRDWLNRSGCAALDHRGRRCS